MKKIFILLSSLVVMVQFAYSQYIPTPDTRLTAVYSQDYLNDLTAGGPQELVYLNWYLDNSYKVVYAGMEKCELMPYLESFDPTTKTITGNVESIDEGNFNILLYSFERQYSKKTYYRIGNTGYAIEFESHKKLAENFKRYQDEN